MNARSMKRTRRGAGWTAVVALLAGCAGLSYQNRGMEDVRPEPLPGAEPPSYATLRTPLEARVVDRTFRTKEAMFLANEMQVLGFPFYEEAVVGGLADPGDGEFLYMTTTEAYWYSRYNMSALVAESRLGVHTVYGPYVTEWALSSGRANINRNRGDYVRSNKGVLLQEIIPLYLARTGFPRRFEDASPTMLHFASGDPHLVRPLDKGVMFESTENVLRDRDLRKIYGDALPVRTVGMGRGGNDMWKARVNYRENFLSLRWNHGDMEHEIDLGAEGQTLRKEALWAEYFFKGSHHGGRFLGNDPEEGFRGAMLALNAVSKMLMLKGAMLFDGERLGGVDPRGFEPGSAYFPHRIGVRMRAVGDLPPRPEELKVVDSSSQLFDQASLLWGLGEFYHFADPGVADNWDRVFGDPRRDGSLMEREYLVLAEGLAEMVLRNVAAMHRRADGALVSEWRPGEGAGTFVRTEDVGMTAVALADYARNVPADGDARELALDLLWDQADFLIARLQSPDGSIAAGFDFQAGRATGEAPALLAQGFALLGLTAAHRALGDARYADAAREVYGFMNRDLWDDATGVYRSHAGAEVTVYTPLNLGVALRAVKEMALLDHSREELQRYKRFWVQAVNGSGIQQAEYEETGEKDFFAADGDGDGIPRMEYGDGKHGIAPVFAARVEIATPARGAVARR